MEEKKVFDFSTPNGKNILVYLLDEDGDDPVLLFVKKQYGMYGTFITDDSTNLFMEMFERFEVGDVMTISAELNTLIKMYLILYLMKPTWKTV